MNNEVLIISGSSGLIGSALINAVGPHYTEMALDRESPRSPPPETEHVISCDISSDESVRDALAQVRRIGGSRIASVVHLAAYYDFSGEPSPLYDKITVEGTSRLLRGLQSFDVEQFIFSSTMLVHAPCEPGERIDEHWPLDPKWDYPQSKVKTENVILEERGRIPVVILRIAGVYDDDCHSIPLAHQIKRIYEKQLTATVFPGDVQRGQSFLHLDDLVDALRRTIERQRELPPVTTLLIGEPETLSYDWLQRAISRQLQGEEWETQKIPKALAKTGAWVQDVAPGIDPFIKPWMIDLADDHYALDISRAEQVLGWKPKRSLRETLPKMLERLKADPEAWYHANKLEK